MKEQNVVQTRKAELNEKLRKLRAALLRRRSRATANGDEQKVWEANFDLERLSKHGGLISVHEKAPFIDCETVEEDLHTRRIFAYAFRCWGIDCPDIQPTESIDQFCKRVTSLWYDKPLGRTKSISFFVNLTTFHFDEDLGFSGGPYDGEWFVRLGSETVLTAEQIAVLPVIGKPEAEWKKQGFETWAEWDEHVKKEQKRKKDLEELEKTLPTPAELEQRLSKTSTESTTPKLLYQGVITEH